MERKNNYSKDSPVTKHIVQKTTCTLSVIISGILWGIISLFLKPLSYAGLSLIQILMLRSFISAIVLLIFLFIKDKTLLKIQLKDIWMFIGTGIISLSFFSYCYFATILENGASIAVVLLYTSPVFVMILSSLLFHEKITFIKVIALVCTFVGCVLTAGLFTNGNSITLKGFFIGLCSGLGYALYSIFSKYALRKYNILTINLYTFIFSSVSLIPFCKITQIPKFLTGSTLIFAIAIAVICTVLPYIFYTFGLAGLETTKAAILVTVEPLVGTILGLFIYKEPFNIYSITGIILILLAIILCGIQIKAKKTKHIK